MKAITLLLITLWLAIGCKPKSGNDTISKITIDTLQGLSLTGSQLIVKQLDSVKDSSRISNFILARDEYQNNQDNADALIWMGRRIAYLGDYKEAINVFSEGLEKFPEDARIYRHRGHRYITLRSFDNAILDLEKAANLIKGKPDIIEPDGVPNIRNTPISTLNSNIWYHLGLSYYLKDDMPRALLAFEQSMDETSNPDKQVSSGNWLYMIHRRMRNIEEAENLLSSISADMDVFENMAYHQLLLFYKGEITEEQLTGLNEKQSYINEATAYGLGNWYLYNGDTIRAVNIFKDLISKGNWASFGYIAAEADLMRIQD